ELEQFEVQYQPQIDTSSRAIVGVEALVRWQHPERGLVFPAEFIPAAEESGLILPLGLWVLRTACQQAQAWIQHRGDCPLQLSVNLSPQQMKQADLVGDVALILAETGF